MFGKKAVKFWNYLSSQLFTLAMTNKLVVIINSLKVPKIKKILLYEMKFLVQNYSCLQKLWLGGYRPRSPFSLSSVLNWICWTLPPPTQTKFLGTPLLHSNTTTYQYRIRIRGQKWQHTSLSVVSISNLTHSTRKSFYNHRKKSPISGTKISFRVVTRQPHREGDVYHSLSGRSMFAFRTCAPVRRNAWYTWLARATDWHSGD